MIPAIEKATIQVLKSSVILDLLIESILEWEAATTGAEQSQWADRRLECERELRRRFRKEESR